MPTVIVLAYPDGTDVASVDIARTMGILADATGRRPTVIYAAIRDDADRVLAVFTHPGTAEAG